MGLIGKNVIQADIKFNGDVLHGLFRYRLHELLKIAPEYVKGCELQEGDWGAVGSISNWNYVIDGKSQVCKMKIEAVDEENKSITFKVCDGDLMMFYTSFKLHMNVVGNYEKSTVTWTFEYEKMNVNIPDPDSLVAAAQNILKFVETRLTSVVDVKIPQLQ